VIELKKQIKEILNLDFFFKFLMLSFYFRNTLMYIDFEVLKYIKFFFNMLKLMYFVKVSQ